MAKLEYQERRNIEDSLKEFLETQISSQSLTVFNNSTGSLVTPLVGVGFAEDDTLALPNILVYCDTKTAIRGFVGGNRRLKDWLIIVDIRATDDGMRSDLAEWVQETINNGFTYYEYSPNPASPDNPIKVDSGICEVTFFSDAPVRLQNVSTYDKYRHNITISVDINGEGV